MPALHQTNAPFCTCSVAVLFCKTAEETVKLCCFVFFPQTVLWMFNMFTFLEWACLLYY